MNRKVSKILSFMLAFTMLLSVASFTAAARASAQLRSYGASLVDAGNGDIDIEFRVTGMGTMDELGVKTVKVYKSNGTLVKTFTYTSYDEMMGYDTGRHSGVVTYSGVEGQRYYAVVTFYGKNSAGSDSRTYTTSTVTA